MKPIILCADDYGISPSVGAGIRELVAKGRLSAVSCISNAPAWPQEAILLKPLRNHIDVGLHFNLTLGFTDTAPPLSGWIKNSLTGHIDQEHIRQEFRQQLDRFESAWGSPPDFVDGHQHVHIFPGIRCCLFRQLVNQYAIAKRPWIRRVTPSLIGHDAPMKTLILNMLSINFVKEAHIAGLKLSGAFAGAYSLSPQANFPAMMAGWLQRATPGTVLMCHPGMSADQDPEDIGQTRVQEFRYLTGEEFDKLCKREKINLRRFNEIFHATSD